MSAKIYISFFLFITRQCTNVFFFSFQVVKLLLRYGGDPCQSNRRGETPLKVANSPTMLNLLLGKGTYTSSEESSSGMQHSISIYLGHVSPQMQKHICVEALQGEKKWRIK